MTTANLDRSGVAAPRHARIVRITHWLTTAAFVAVLMSGIEVLLSHPGFYWGEVGNGAGAGQSAVNMGYAWYAGT